MNKAFFAILIAVLTIACGRVFGEDEPLLPGGSGGSYQGTEEPDDGPLFTITRSGDSCIPEVIVTVESTHPDIDQGERTPVLTFTVEHATLGCQVPVTISDMQFKITSTDYPYWCTDGNCDVTVSVDDGWNFSEILLVSIGGDEEYMTDRAGFSQLSSMNEVNAHFDAAIRLDPGEWQTWRFVLTVANTDKAAEELGDRSYRASFEYASAALPNGGLVAVQGLPSNDMFFDILDGYEGTGTAAICEPGEGAVCACPHDIWGWQACNASGDAYGPCSCPDPSGAGGEGGEAPVVTPAVGGASGAGGQGGSPSIGGSPALGGAGGEAGSETSGGAAGSATASPLAVSLMYDPSYVKLVEYDPYHHPVSRIVAAQLPLSPFAYFYATYRVTNDSDRDIHLSSVTVDVESSHPGDLRTVVVGYQPYYTWGEQSPSDLGSTLTFGLEDVHAIVPAHGEMLLPLEFRPARSLSESVAESGDVTQIFVRSVTADSGEIEALVEPQEAPLIVLRNGYPIVETDVQDDLASTPLVEGRNVIARMSLSAFGAPVGIKQLMLESTLAEGMTWENLSIEVSGQELDVSCLSPSSAYGEATPVSVMFMQELIVDPSATVTLEFSADLYGIADAPDGWSLVTRFANPFLYEDEVHTFAIVGVESAGFIAQGHEPGGTPSVIMGGTLLWTDYSKGIDADRSLYDSALEDYSNRYLVRGADDWEFVRTP